MANGPSYVYTTFCLSIHLLMDTRVVSTFWLLEQCCYEHWHTSICLRVCFQFFWICTEDGIAGKHGNSMFNFSEELPNCIPQQLHHFAFPPIMHKSSNFFTSSPTLVILHFFSNCHPSVCCILFWTSKNCILRRGYGLHQTAMEVPGTNKG